MSSLVRPIFKFLPGTGKTCYSKPAPFLRGASACSFPLPFWLLLILALFQTQNLFAFSIGDRVQCTQNLNVRSSASTSGSLLTTESSGSQGTIASGPQSANGYTWWYINWANGYSGWSVQDYIATITIYTLNVASSNPGSGVYIYVSPNDTQGRADGNTAFSRTFASGTSVTLIAPLSASGNNFQKWQLNGSDYGFSTTINFTLSGNYTMTAVFVAAPPATHTLTIASSNPNSGVIISGNQSDNNSLYGGTTSFTRTFYHNASVSFNAPSTASGNIFQKWQKDGVDLTTSTTASMTLDANHTITAVYAAPPTQAPTVQTLPATSIGNSTATLNGQVTSDGGASILEERFSWGSTAACSDGFTSAVTPSGNTFSYSLVEIPPGTYYYQAWARNSGGWGHSPAASFNTISLPAPTISSVNPPTPTGSSISQPFYINGANYVSGCNVILMDITAGKTYANRSITALSTTQIRIDPIFSTAAHSWSVEIQNPDSQTTGQFLFNVAAPGIPTVQTLPATSIGNSTATLNAQVTSDGGSTILEQRFSWGATAACADGFSSAVTVNGNNFSYNLVEIPPGTYYYQAWARNSGGWGQSTTASFSTVSLPAPTISSVSPSTPTGSSTAQPFYINGANFVSGCNVVLQDITTGISYANRSITSFSATQIRIDPIFSTAAHSWSVEIQNPDSQTTGQFQFNVVAPGTANLTITAPNSGQNWTAGTAQTISWTVNGTPNQPVSHFTLNYSLNGGASWQQYGYFASGSAVSGIWSIPTTAVSSQAIVQITAVNASGVAKFWNQSPTFSINSPITGNPTSIPNCNNRSPAPANAVAINFNGAASTGSSPSCAITSYLWTFGDGSTGTGPYPSHTYYPSIGSVTTYQVYLQVTDFCGKIAANTQPLTITITGQALGNSNPTQPTSKDPVNLATGNYTYNHVDLRLPGRGLPFEFQRFYNSKANTSTGLPLGYGWTDSYNIALAVSPSNNAVVITFGDGHAEMYSTNGTGGYVSQSGIYNILTSSGGNYTLTTKEQQQYNFNSSGQLSSIVDKNNNTVSLGYSGINLTTITNTVGRAIIFAYNDNNCLTNITDPLGRTVQFAYDANTNLVSVTDTRGGLTRFGYDEFHQITNAIDPRGNTFVSMQYDNLQRVVSSQKDALQGATTFSYDFVNNVTTVVDAMTNISYYHYDGELRVKEIDDNLGNKQFFQYDTNNNRIQVTDKNGKSTAYSYDANGNVISKTDPFTQTTTIAYDALNNPTNRVDAQNGLTIFSYDTNGNLTNTINSLGKTNTYHYDAFGEPVVVTDANGNTTTNIYDSFGNLILTRNGLGGTNAFAYDVVSRKLHSVDALGRTNLFFYDNADNLTSTVNALGKTNRFSYDGNNNRVTVTDFRGYTATNIYDAKDRLIIARDPLGNSITNDYDALDRKIRVWDAMGGVTRFGYDVVGNLLAITNAAGGVTRYAYDPNGNRTNIVDALGNSTTNLFDSLNRLVSISDALGHTSASVYDSLGRRVQGIDPLNRTNFFAYDPMGRLTNFTDTAGGTVVNTYDNVGNRLFSTDPNGHTTTNVFDALNRLSQTTDPTGGFAKFDYDEVGNLLSRKDPNGQITTYLYDTNNRQTRIAYPTGTPVTFGYDDNGNRTSMTDALGTTTYSYDALNRLTSVTDCYGKTVSYGYDQNGNRTSITYPGGKTVTYAYDAMNRLKTVTDWLYNTTTYNYDADGNLTSSINPNGSAVVYQYDPANRLLALTNTINSAIISSYQYTLDAIGNHGQVNQTEPLPTIPVVGSSTYGYDNDSKQITLDGQTQGFDANGNMTSVNPTNLLAYDYENRLVQTSFAGTTNTYQYDGAGNRLSANRSGVVTHYVLDRNSPLAQVLAETDASGNVIYYYIHGLGLVSRIDAGGNAQFYHFDSRGSTIAMTDGTGQITEAYAYDPFGRPINAKASDNRFRYLGRHGIMDEENGLLYVRARYYSPKHGRFISKDPKNGQDGDGQTLNRYSYALNNPTRLIDVSGLSSQEGVNTSTGNGSSSSANSGAVYSLLQEFVIKLGSEGVKTATEEYLKDKMLDFLLAKGVSSTAAGQFVGKVFGKGVPIVGLFKDMGEHYMELRATVQDRNSLEDAIVWFTDMGATGVIGLSATIPFAGPFVATGLAAGYDTYHNTIINHVEHNPITDWYGQQIYGAFNGTSFGNWLGL